MTASSHYPSGVVARDAVSAGIDVLRRLDPARAARIERVIPADAPLASVVGLPGVGVTSLRRLLGARAGEGESGAAVTVVVLDAAVPLGADELALLDDWLADPAGTVFVLGKTDLHTDWQSVLERDRALLRKYRGAFADAPIAAVNVRDGMGVDQVAALIDEMAAACDEDRRRFRVLTASQAALRDAVCERRLRAESLRRDGELERMRVRRQELVRARSSGRNGPADLAALRSGFQLARVDLAHEVAAQCRAVSTEVRQVIERSDREALARIPDALNRRLAWLSTELTARVHSRLAAIAPGAAPPPAVSLIQSQLSAGPEHRRRGVEDRMMIAVGASGGLGLGRLVVAPMSLVPAWDLVSIPLTLGLGGIAAWWMVRARAQIADRNQVRQWATDVVGDFRARGEQAVLAALVEHESRAIAQVSGANAAHNRRIDEQIMVMDAELSRESARRGAALRSLDSELNELDEAIRAIRDELSGFGTEPAPVSARPMAQTHSEGMHDVVNE